MNFPARWFWIIGIVFAGCATTPPQRPTYDDGYRAGAGICIQSMSDAQAFIDSERKKTADLSRRLDDCLEADARGK